MIADELFASRRMAEGGSGYANLRHFNFLFLCRFITFRQWHCIFHQDDGSHYYYNSETSQTQWDPPDVGYGHSKETGLDPNALHAAVSHTYTSSEHVRQLVAEGYSPDAANEDGDS